MSRIAFAAVASFTLVAALPCAQTRAQNTASFVSGHGNDSNPCTLAAPCRSFQRAHDQTNSGGEVDVLDPAGYGPLVITKGISIVNDGVGTARIVGSAGGAGITISAPLGEAVNLRGLTIEGAGIGHNGIQSASALSLTIENCFIRHWTNRGLEFKPEGSSSLFVSNTLVADNGVRGIIVQNLPGSGALKVVLNRVQVTNHTSSAGITFDNEGNVSSSINAVVTDSIVAANGVGISVTNSSVGVGPNVLYVVRSVISNNDTGLSADGLANVIYLSESTVTGTVSSGIAQSGWSVTNNGSVQSAGDNTIFSNGPPIYNKK